MPKKPPFNHFRKSCRSPSNSNKKEKGITSAICSLQGMCLPIPQVDVWGRGVGGAGGAVPGGPASPTLPWHMLDLSAPEDPLLRHLHVSPEQLPAAEGASRGIPPCPATPAGTTGAAVPTHQRNPLAGHTRSTGSHSVSGIPQSFVSAC